MPPTPLTIPSTPQPTLSGAVVVLTGGSSGIGLATATYLSSIHACHIISGDLKPTPPQSTESDTKGSIAHVETDVTSWPSLRNLFKTAIDKYGRIDHVFANAGIGGGYDIVGNDAFDNEGMLKEPDWKVLDVNLKAVMNTVRLGIYYMKPSGPGKNATNGEGMGEGEIAKSIVLTASASSFQPFQQTGYTAAKHGVLGFMRALSFQLGLSKSGLCPIRVNCITPSWTNTGLVSEDTLNAANVPFQEPDVVARSVAWLMAGRERDQMVVYSREGRFWEVEEGLRKAGLEVLPGESEAVELDRIGQAYMRSLAKK